VEKMTMWRRNWIVAVLPITLLVIFLVAVVATASMPAQGQAPGVQMERSVWAAGGERVAAGDYIVAGTIGEAVVAAPACAGAVCAGAGFWSDAGATSSLYLPVIRR
jgi:hypothetical protein